MGGCGCGRPILVTYEYTPLPPSKSAVYPLWKGCWGVGAACFFQGFFKSMVCFFSCLAWVSPDTFGDSAKTSSLDGCSWVWVSPVSFEDFDKRMFRGLGDKSSNVAAWEINPLHFQLKSFHFPSPSSPRLRPGVDFNQNPFYFQLKSFHFPSPGSLRLRSGADFN